jgi:TonB-dependent receptor
MKKNIILTLIICLAASYSLFAQTGSIAGILTDSQTGETLIGANVIIKGTTNGSVTDINGEYKIYNLQPGQYSIVLSYVGYSNQSVDNIAVEAGKTTTLNFKMLSNVKQLKEANVSTTRITHTENAVLAEMRKAEQVVVGVSSQQIGKTQDKNATEVIRRLPGVTVIEDRFIMIRGLSERYNAVLLNDALAPSVESDKKAFSFDLIPSNMIDRILIYKSGAPELPGEFAGGAIKIYTKNFPDKDFITAGYTIGVRSGTTFNNFYQSAGKSNDWMGIDNGSRDLPDWFPSSISGLTTDQQVALAKDLPNTWIAKQKSAPIDQKFNFGFAKSFTLGKIKAANITNINYSTSYENREAQNYNYNAYNIEQQKSDTIYSYNDNTYSKKVNWSIMHNWAFQLSSKTKIEFRNLFNQTGNNSTAIRTGENFEEGNLVRNYAFRYNERSIYSGQLSGSHHLNQEKTKINWNLGYSFTKSKEPDYRRLRTFNSIYDTDTSYVVQINTTASQQDAGRFYSNLREDIGMASVDLEQDLYSINETRKVKLKAGAYVESKSRAFSARWMSYKRASFDNFDYSLLYLPVDQVFSAENINDSTGFKIDEGTNATDKYTADNFLTAGYVSISWPISDKLNASGGVRIENNQQHLSSKNNNGNKIEVDNPTTKLLPSINLSYNLNSKSLIRLAYARTLNRPEFRELAPYAYYDFIFNNVLKGNTQLKTPDIDNIDARWEFYPGIGELISAGLFYKVFTNPIEQYFEPGAGSGGTRNFIFNNADKATSYGIEFDIKKALEPIFKTGLLSKLAIGANTSLIKSNVNLGSQAVGQKSNRPMMGQSPYTVNAGVYYTNEENGLQCNLLYNIVGKRVYAVGTVGTPDVYELSRNSIDFSISKKLGKFVEVKAGAQDILNEAFRLKQDSNEDGEINNSDETIMSYKRGSLFSLGFSVKY